MLEAEILKVVTMAQAITKVRSELPNYRGRADKYTGISNVAFHWMLEKISPFLAISSKRLQYGDGALNSTLYFEATTPLPETRLDKVSDLAGFPAKERFRKTPAPGWGTGPVEDSCSGVTALAGSATRRPGDESAIAVDGTVRKLKMLGDTNECIHSVVAWRKQAFKVGDQTYNPPALEGWIRQLRAMGKAMNG